jgi:hypothetical protein
MKTFLLLLLSVLLFSSCGNRKKNITSIEEEKNQSEIPKAIIKKMPSALPNVSINKMKIEEGILFLNVSYSGGCENQTFELIGNEMIMKSMPPKRTLSLVRDDKGDNCREWITEDLKFDLNPVMLEADPTKQIIFILANNQQEIPLINESM